MAGRGSDDAGGAVFARTLQRYATGAWRSAGQSVTRLPRIAAQMAAARLGLGIGPHLFALYGLDRKPRATWPGYIANPGNKSMYNGVNPPSQRRPLVDKLLFHAECRRHGLATAPILALFANDRLVDAHGVPSIEDPAHFERLLAAHPQGLFLKRVDGSHGEGAFRVLHAGGGCLLPEGPASIAATYAHCRERAREHALIVQPRLANHAALQPLMAGGGFGTVRAVTWLDGDAPRLVAALLRIVAGDNVADNFNGGTSGNLLAAIDVAHGVVLGVRRSRSREWPDIVDEPAHPARGMAIPQWAETLALVTRAHRAFAALGIVGWDVGITADGPLLVEGNAAPDFDLVQVAYDRGFRAELERVVGPLSKRVTDR
jgi:hypothetical protein